MKLFLRIYLFVITKRNVYKAVVLSILLYGAETWTRKAPDLLPSITIVCVEFLVCLSISSRGKELLLKICQRNLVCSGQYYGVVSLLAWSHWSYE